MNGNVMNGNVIIDKYTKLYKILYLSILLE